jgi:hypothetical protein
MRGVGSRSLGGGGSTRVQCVNTLEVSQSRREDALFVLNKSNSDGRRSEHRKVEARADDAAGS